ncbi:MAG: hypothetical protein KGN76_06750 [Acidobacteriota bacterium]|nr:hypothetical protein [Acidobacteriota bacterium]
MKQPRSGQRLAIAAALVAVLAAAAGAPAGADQFSKRDALAFVQKIDAIHAHAGGKSRAPLKTAISEREVNAYLALDGAADLPPGIGNVRVSLIGPGRLSGSALVDLDVVRRNQKAKGSLLDPMAFLTGRLPVSVTGVLTTHAGEARFQLESAQIAGVQVPRMVIDELLAYYAKTPGTPKGVTLDSSFPLPDRIQQIDVQRGQAIVVQ